MNNTVILTPFNMESRKKIYKYHYTIFQECDYSYEIIDNLPANLAYHRKTDHDEIIFNDTKNYLRTNNCSYDYNYNTIGEFTVFTGTDEFAPCTIYNHILVIKPKSPLEVDPSNEYYFTMESFLYTPIGDNYEMYKMFTPTEYTIQKNDFTIIVGQYYKGKANIDKELYIEALSGLDVEIVSNVIIEECGEYVNKTYINESNNSINYIIGDSACSITYNNNNTQVLDLLLLSLSDIHVNSHNYISSTNNNYNFWYNDGKKMIYNGNNYKLSGEQFINDTNKFLIKTSVFTGLTENINSIQYKKNDTPKIIETTNIKQVWYNQTITTEKEYSILYDLMSCTNEIGEKIYFTRDSYGNVIDKYGKKKNI